MNTNSFKSRTLGIILSIAVILSMMAVAVPATPVQAATTWYVATTGDDTTGTGSSSAPWKTIAKAIASATGGDTIMVAAGTYAEDFKVDKALTIRGAEYNIDPTATGSGWTGSTVITAGGNAGGTGQPDYAGYSPHLKASNIDFRGFKIMSDGTPRSGLYVGGDAAGTLSNITIAYCELTGRSEAGVILGAMGGTVLSSIVIDHVYSHANPTGNGIKTVNVGNPTISNCKISDNGLTGTGNSQYGVWIGATNDAVSIPSTISGNTFSGNNAGAILLKAHTGSNQDTTGTVISNNNFNDGSTKYGINNAIVTAHTVNGEFNWWGNTSGPGGGTGALVSSDVDYTPWLVNDISVTLPASGDCIPGGSLYQVTWTSHSVPGAQAAVQVYNGSSWGSSTILGGLAQGVNTLQINMPSVNSSSCKVKVTISGGGGLDYYAESSTFRIDNVNPTVSLGAIAPCLKGSSTATLPFIVGDTGYTTLYNYTIQYSLDGTNWANISPQASFNNQSTGTKNVSWTVPSANSTICKWRVTATDCAGNYTTLPSAYTFTIDSIAPTATLTSPLSGTLTAGSTINVTFTGSDALSPNLTYTVRYSTDSGANWISSTSENTTEATGSRTRSWLVPSISSATVRLGVWTTDCAGNGSAVSQSTSDITITSTAAPTVAVVAPDGGETWRAGSTQIVRWTATDVVTGDFTNIRIYYTFNYPTENCTWGNDSTGTYAQGPGSYSWLVPTPLATSTTCRVKVEATDSLGNVGSDISYNNFTINVDTAPPVWVTLNSPNATGISWQAGTAQTISWTAGSSVPDDMLDIKLYYSTNGSDPSNLITTLNGRAQGADCFCWAVPYGTPTAAYKVKVVASVTGSPTLTNSATSANAFTVTAESADWGITTGTITGLKTGWNLISLPLIPTACPSAASGLTTSCSCTYPIEGVLASILDKVDRVWYYNNNGTTASWIGYKPGSPSPLTRMEDGKAYWVYVTGDCTLTFQGRKSASAFMPGTTYSTVAGWNMVGFKSTVSAIDVHDYLGVPCPSTIYSTPIYEQITFGSLSAGYNLLYCDDHMNTGKGYWVFYNTAGTFRAVE